jgi:hypothetical protein
MSSTVLVTRCAAHQPISSALPAAAPPAMRSRASPSAWPRLAPQPVTGAESGLPFARKRAPVNPFLLSSAFAMTKINYIGFAISILSATIVFIAHIRIAIKCDQEISDQSLLRIMLKFGNWLYIPDVISSIPKEERPNMAIWSWFIGFAGIILGVLLFTV